MKLDEAQQQKVAGWVAEGLALADIQKQLDLYHRHGMIDRTFDVKPMILQ